MKTITQIPSWLDTSLYPFEHKFIKLQSGQMHYVDQGAGDPILFIHGTPTWSFLYRGFISTLSKNNRCIAIDHIGFGLSDKPANFDGKPESHAHNLTEFIQKLDLTNITIVVHDFGGSIGLASAIENKDRIKQIVLFNTWMWETKSNPEVLKVDKIINSRIGHFLYLRMNFSPKVLLKKVFYDKKKLTKRIHNQYTKPFPNKTSRLSLLNLGKSLLGSSNWYQEQWYNLNKIESKPWLIIWGTKDQFITTDYLQKWKTRLPHAKTVILECGHFVQEEKTNEAIKAIQNFLL